MARRFLQTVRAIHITGENLDEKMIINARVEMKGQQYADQVNRRKDKFAADLHAFMVARGYNPLAIKFHKSRQ
jgi:hypothetical protein